MKQKFTFLLLFLSFIFTITSGFSAVRSWTGNTSNNWSTGSNWSGGSKPNSSDDVIITGAGNYQPTLNVSGTYRSLYMNGGNLTLTGALTVTNSVRFYKGILNTTASNVLIVNSTATTTGATDSSHVNGPIRKRGNSYGSFIFPTGNGTFYASIRVSSVTGGAASDYFTAQYFHDLAPYNITSKDASLNNLSTLEYWSLTTTDLRAYVTLSFHNSRSGGITNISDLRIARWDGSSWRDHGGSASGSTSSGTIITGSRLNTFGPFTLSSSSSMNPLPIELINFEAIAVEKAAKLIWSTTFDENLNRFEVYRSNDGFNYLPIGTIEATMDNHELVDYSFEDIDINVNGSQVVYYRLKIIDNNGEFKTSHISKVKFTESVPTALVTVYPNPSTDFINIKLTEIQSSELNITIMDGSGKVIQSHSNIETNADNTVNFDVRGLENGIYFLNIYGIPSLQKFIKK